MTEEEQARRLKSFKKKASIKQRSFEKLDQLLEDSNKLEKAGASSSDDDDDGGVGDDDDLIVDDSGGPNKVGGVGPRPPPKGVKVPGAPPMSLGQGVSRLNSSEFSSIMDTLSVKAEKPAGRKHAPLPNITLSPVLDGLSNLGLCVRAGYHMEQNSRPYQEDHVAVILDLSALGESTLGPRAYLYERLAFFAVYDGHSGATCAAALQRRLHLAVVQAGGGGRIFEDVGRALHDACLSLDREVCAELMESEDQSGSTACVLLLDGRTMDCVVANVGDSRCVLSRGGTAIELSRDHRLDRPDERLRVERSGGVVRDRRVNGVLAITRSFGDAAHKTGGIDATPEVRKEKVAARDEFAIVATDGLWDVMDSQQAVNFVRLQLAKHRRVDVAARELVKQAVKLGSVDNVSAVVVCLNQPNGDGGADAA
jgi:serine/threonine protein phosphatase PrpC